MARQRVTVRQKSVGRLPDWARVEALVTGYKGEPMSPALVRDGPATAADLCFPTSVAVGPNGEVYVAEPYTTLVRVVAHGQVSTLRPTVRRGGAEESTPLAFERPARVVVRDGQLYVLEDVPDSGLGYTVKKPYVYSRVWRIDLRTREATLLQMPEGEDQESREWWVDHGLSLDYIWAMSGSSGEGIVLLLLQRDALFSTQRGGSLRRYRRLNHKQLWGIFGQEREGPFVAPYFARWGVALLPDGRVAFAYRGVVALVGNNGRISILAGSLSEAGHRDGKGDEARFDQASAITWDPHRKALIVADAGSDSVRAVTLGGEVTTIAGGEASPIPYDGVGREVRFSMPTDVCVTPWGDVFVADSGFNLIRRIAPDGTVSIVAGRGRRYVVPLSFPGYRATQ